MFCNISKDNIETNLSVAVKNQFETLEQACRQDIAKKGYAIYRGYLFQNTIDLVEEDGLFRVEICGEKNGAIIYRISLSIKCFNKSGTTEAKDSYHQMTLEEYQKTVRKSNYSLSDDFTAMQAGYKEDM